MTKQDDAVPAGLGKSGRALWIATVGPYELDKHEELLLLAACRCADTLDRLAIESAGSPVTVANSKGDLAPHPAITEGRQQSLALANRKSENADRGRRDVDPGATQGRCASAVRPSGAVVRIRPAVEPSRVKPPPADLPPTVARWVTPAEINAHTRGNDCPVCTPGAAFDKKGNPIIDCGYAVRFRAWRRWTDHRLDWLERHGIDQREYCKRWPLRGFPSVAAPATWGGEGSALFGP